MKVEDIDVNSEMGEIGEILPERRRKKGIVIHALQQIQKDMRYLPEDVVTELSRHLGMPLSEIYSVASFYKMFHFDLKMTQKAFSQKTELFILTSIFENF